MKKIPLTNKAYQVVNEYLDNGNVLTLKFYYRPNAFAWFVDIQYEGIIRKNIQLSAGTNIFRAFQNIIPADLYIKTSSIMKEAYIQDSFTLSLAELYLVNFEERDAIINGEISS